MVQERGEFVDHADDPMFSSLKKFRRYMYPAKGGGQSTIVILGGIERSLKAVNAKYQLAKTRCVS